MKKRFLGFISVIFLPVCSLANVPVVDLSTTETSPSFIHSHRYLPPAKKHRLLNSTQEPEAATTDLTPEERIRRLEQQIKFLREQSPHQTITQLQQTVRDLRGLIEVQGHEIKELKSQQHRLYQDIDQRLTDLSSSKTPTSATTFNSISSDTHAAAHSKKELEEYEAAFKLVRAKKYDRAILKFGQYLKVYPQGAYAARAHYWLGEVSLIAGQTRQSQAEFEIVANQFSKSDKAPDALLKLGLLAYEHKQWQHARQYFNRTKKQYPHSASTQMAQQYLTQLNRAGR
jgi:tol-pal system protein YbgF